MFGVGQFSKHHRRQSAGCHFWRLFLGAGIAFAICGGAVIDGTEILAIFLSKKFGTTVGDITIVINIIIFSVAAYFLSIEIALYSMITYVAASKTLDFIIEGIEEYIGVTIVKEIEKIEPDVFVVINAVKNVKGGIIKQRPLKH